MNTEQIVDNYIAGQVIQYQNISSTDRERGSTDRCTLEFLAVALTGIPGMLQEKTDMYHAMKVQQSTKRGK